MRARQSSNQFSEMTSLVGHKCGLVWGTSGSVSPPSNVFYSPQCFEKLSWGTSAASKQATLCLSDYSKQICGHKYDTLSSRWFMKNVMTAELSFIQSACAAHIWRKHWSGQLSVAGERNLSLGCTWQMKKGQHSKTPTDESQKHTHMHAIGATKQNENEPTASGCSFDKQTLRGKFICGCKWRDGS